MDEMEKIKEIIALPSVKTVTIALAIFMLIQYAFNNVLLDYLPLIVAFLVAGVAAYLIGLVLGKVSYVNMFIMGVVSYLAYFWGLIFFKLSDATFVMMQELQTAALFGALCVAVYWMIENFG